MTKLEQIARDRRIPMPGTGLQVDSSVFERVESAVRTYCRSFPDLFERAQGSWLETASGRRILDLLCGAGSLNYGHNDPAIMAAVVAHIQDGGIVNSLDLHTVEKARFIDAFCRLILKPRGLDYKLQFPGPTGTNAVEASFKIARRTTGRQSIAAFRRGFHGMTLGALAATSNECARSFAGVALEHVEFWPYDGEDAQPTGSVEAIATQLDGRRDEDKPAAAILEIVQGEGGLRAASAAWVRDLAALLKVHGVLLIIDDIQAGCGRTGSFFGFEEAAIVPDIVVLSKSLSGFGTPFSLVLMAPDLDVWTPGAHNGTFRGNNLAFVGARAALENYWRDDRFASQVRVNADCLDERLMAIASSCPGMILRGRGMMRGIEFETGELADRFSKALYRRRVMAETCGPLSRTVKLLPALNIGPDDLMRACDAMARVAGEIFS
jgi:diaminobutyrate-2-oxoglutarate transaminase